MALDVTGDWNLYSYLQLVKKRCMVDARFYMPQNLILRHTDSPEQLERTARELAAAGERVVVLSGDPALAEKSALPLRKLWTRFPVQNKNVYEVRLPAAERPDGTVRSAPEGSGAAG